MHRKTWIGIILVILGISLILNQMELIDLSTVWSNWWPALFIIIGLLVFEKRSWGTSIFFIFLGIFLLVNNFVDVNLFVYIWPIILIFIGLTFIFVRGRRTKIPHTNKDIKTVAILSGAEVQSQTEDFKGGEIVAILGGAEVDLRDIKLNEAGAVLELTAILGGIELRVPENMHVKVSGLPILGGAENKLRKNQEHTAGQPILKINYTAILGGIEIRN